MTEDVIGTRTYGGLFADSERLVPTATMLGAGATCRQAARSRVDAAEGRARVLAALRKAPDGLTRTELAAVTGLAGGSVNGRCAELVAAKLAFTEGMRERWLEHEGRFAVESIVRARP